MDEETWRESEPSVGSLGTLYYMYDNGMKVFIDMIILKVTRLRTVLARSGLTT